VEVALHDLGGTGRTLLMSHATGFHGRCYSPVAALLADRFHTHALDYRGHGDTPRPPGVPVDWNLYANDVVAVAEVLARALGPLVAFGHSMGGACLLIAAHDRPELFDRLVLFEPIVIPPEGMRPDGGPSPLAEGARRRRASFPSFEDAIANYVAKPPLNVFTPEAIEAYVLHGFRHDDDGHVYLKCEPETEALTFEMSAGNRSWTALPEIVTPVVVATGRVEPFQPSALAERVAEMLPNGQYVELADLDHFGPMTHPDRVAELIAQAAAADVVE
jgi:pimeloyl-ACP methyl ester carboxylesterase